MLTLDETLKARVQKLKAKREETLIQLSGIKRQQQLPIKNITNRHIKAFCTALKKRFNDSDSGFGKGYIRLLVDEISIKDNQAVMTGNYGALAQTVSTPENHILILNQSQPTLMVTRVSCARKLIWVRMSLGSVMLIATRTWT